MTNINDPAYDPNPYAHAVRHLDEAEEGSSQWPSNYPERARVEALLGIGWALLAIARKP